MEGCEVQAEGRTVAQLEAKRNDILVDMMKLFRQHGVASGKVLAREEKKALETFRRWQPGDDVSQPLHLWDGEVITAWLDYNGHMTDAAYLYAFGDGLDAFFRYMGDDEAYRATGNTFYTVETHLNYYQELKLGERFRIETQVVGCDPKRMHLFHRMFHADTDVLVATNEIMQVHVFQGEEVKTVPMSDTIYTPLSTIWAEHQKLEKPTQQGSVMQVRRK